LLVLDVGGDDDDQLWTGPRAWPLLGLRSEAAAGADGEWPLPFPLRLLTRPAAPAAPR
jgi:hypothetical protein